MTTNPAVWYLMRSTGVVALLLLTVSFGLGIATANRWHPRHARLHVTTRIHRNASLLSVVFLVVHVLTAIVDPDAQVSAIRSVLPVGSPWALATGVLSLDLLTAVVVTSIGRRRLSYRVWRLVHWSSYLAWPLAVVHTLGMGSDVSTWWLKATTVGCITAMGGIVGWRLTEQSLKAA